MTASAELMQALLAGGMDPTQAGLLIARAAVELRSAVKAKSANAMRQQRLRDRRKALRKALLPVTESVTERYETVTKRYESVTVDEAKSVTKRDESVTNNVTRNAPSLSIDKKEEVKKEKRESRAVAMPDDWRPNEKSWAAAIAKLGSDDRSELELRKFHNHALDKGRTSKNWNAAWNNWVDRAIVYGASNAHGPSQNRANPATGHKPTREADFVAALGRGAANHFAKRGPTGFERTLPGSPDTADPLAGEPETDARAAQRGTG